MWVLGRQSLQAVEHHLVACAKLQPVGGTERPLDLLTCHISLRRWLGIVDPPEPILFSHFRCLWPLCPDSNRIS